MGLEELEDAHIEPHEGVPAKKVPGDTAEDSGEQAHQHEARGQRETLGPAGERKLNYAMHMVTTCQARSEVRGGAYYRKKIAEGMSSNEALRCPKRRISDAVFSSLVADSRTSSSSAARQRGAENAVPAKFTPP